MATVSHQASAHQTPLLLLMELASPLMLSAQPDRPWTPRRVSVSQVTNANLHSPGARLSRSVSTPPLIAQSASTRTAMMSAYHPPTAQLATNLRMDNASRSSLPAHLASTSRTDSVSVDQPARMVTPTTLLLSFVRRQMMSAHQTSRRSMVSAQMSTHQPAQLVTLTTSSPDSVRRARSSAQLDSTSWMESVSVDQLAQPASPTTHRPTSARRLSQTASKDRSRMPMATVSLHPHHSAQLDTTL